VQTNGSTVYTEFSHAQVSARESPPQPRRGGRDIKKKTAQPPLMERTGWCWSKDMCDFLTNTTPSARLRMLRNFSHFAQPPLLC